MNIETKRLVLRAVEPMDARFLADLINDPEVRDSLGAYNLVFPVSADMEQRWIESSSKTNDTHLIIELRDTRDPIGLLSLKDLNKRNGSVHLSVILQKKSWDMGYGSEAISGTVNLLFDRMNMRRVWLRVAEYNRRAMACYEKCGFKLEGTLRQDHFARDEWHDSHIMSILASDFRGRKP